MSDEESEKTVIRAGALVVTYDQREYVVPPDFHGLFAIGRGAACQIVLDSHVVSRLHGCIRYAGGSYNYRDTSSNGTILITGHDETLVQDAEVELPESGVLKVGDVTLSFNWRH